MPLPLRFLIVAFLLLVAAGSLVLLKDALDEPAQSPDQTSLAPSSETPDGAETDAQQKTATEGATSTEPAPVEQEQAASGPPSEQNAAEEAQPAIPTQETGETAQKADATQEAAEVAKPAVTVSPEPAAEPTVQGAEESTADAIPSAEADSANIDQAAPTPRPADKPALEGTGDQVADTSQAATPPSIEESSEPVADSLEKTSPLESEDSTVESGQAVAPQPAGSSEPAEAGAPESATAADPKDTETQRDGSAASAQKSQERLDTVASAEAEPSPEVPEVSADTVASQGGETENETVGPAPPGKTGETAVSDTSNPQSGDGAKSDDNVTMVARLEPKKADASAQGTPASGESLPQALAPEFDVVRAEPTGEAVLAGRGSPGAEIEILSNGTVVASVKADERSGEWVAVLADPLEPGTHDLSATARLGDGPRTSSEDRVAVAIPDRAGEGLLVIRDRPGAASTVLANQPPAGSESGAAQQPADAVMPKSAEVEIEAVESENNTLYVAGAGQPGGRIFLYADNAPLGETQVGETGRWLYQAGHALKLGDVFIRADHINAEGTVLSRAEVSYNQPASADASAAGGNTGSPDTGSSATPTPQEAKADAAQPPSIIIRRGDNLWSIARRTYGRGIRYTMIYEANTNQIRNPDLIYPGQVFMLPDMPKDQ